jgi:hypothetical protein
MLVEICHRIKSHSTVKAGHAFWTIVFYVVEKLKKVVRCGLVRADGSFPITLEIHFAAMALLEV